MRVNVYNEELTERVELIEAQANGEQYYGLRFYLESSERLYPPIHPDNDSSAVTFWTKDVERLKDIFTQAIAALCSDT